MVLQSTDATFSQSIASVEIFVTVDLGSSWTSPPWRWRLKLEAQSEPETTIANANRNEMSNINKGNNKITELRTILQRESQNS